jgi:hypothetical protein
MSRNDYAIELVCREELKAMEEEKPRTPEDAKTIAALRRILRNVKNGDDITNADWEVYQQAKEDVNSAINDL